jgi:hypothetical protein
MMEETANDALRMLQQMTANDPAMEEMIKESSCKPIFS